MNSKSLTKVELIAHPVRLRILIALGGRRLTPAQIGRYLPEVPQATLYRHLNALAAGGVIEVVAERAVNGAMERTYALVAGQARLSPDDLASATREDHLHYFNVFMATLLNAATRFLSAADPARAGQPGLSYNVATIYLTDEERDAFHDDMLALVGRVMNNAPAPDRRGYTLASVAIPEAPDEKDESDDYHDLS